MRRPVNLEDVRRRAHRRLPKAVFDFLDGGADDELTLRGNAAAFRAARLVPTHATAVPEPRLATELFGQTYAGPIALAPCGGLEIVHPDGTIAAVRAAAERGLLAVVSSGSGARLEEVAATADPARLWFQLYRHGHRDRLVDLVPRAADAGYGALVVTIDTPVVGNRERDARNGYGVGSTVLRADGRGRLRIDLRTAARFGPDVLRRRRWLTAYLRAGRPFGRGNADGPVVESPPWSELDAIRRRWSGPLLVKGVLSPDDATRARDLGVDGLVVSNHGGRQLDQAIASLHALPRIRAAVGNDLTLLVDGGIRRGAHVVVALASGADAVLIGRPYVWGLAADGRQGVGTVLDLLTGELLRTTQLVGCPDLAVLDRRWLAE